MADESKRLYCPVHGQWFEPGVTVCPIGDCATKLVENWNIRTTGMQVAPPAETQVATEPPEDKSKTRLPIWKTVTEGGTADSVLGDRFPRVKEDDGR